MAADSPAPAVTAQQVAEAVRDAMWRDDRASQALGMAVASIGPGRATLTMTVRADMLNGLGSCHGGLVATLADSAFAFACNAYNEVTVAAGFDVNLLAAARLEDRLTAEAVEVGRSGRTGVYDVTVRNQRGETVAAFRGRSYAAKGRSVVDGWPVGKGAALPSPDAAAPRRG